MRRNCTRLAAVAVAAAIAFSATSLHAEDITQKLTVMDEFQIELPGDPQISPDGKQIVYVRQFADAMTDGRYANLWIVNSDGSGQRPLTTGNHFDSSPRWSPDGTRLAYISTADEKPQIYVRWMASGKAAPITHLDEAPANINWSPDGKYLSFSSFVPSKGPQIAQRPPAPAGAKWAEPAKAYESFVYRINGGGYLRPGFSQLFIVSSAGGAARQIGSGDFPNDYAMFLPNRAVWSPDGKYLIASANRHPSSDHEFLDSNVYELAVADGTVRMLTERNGPDDSPAISPNGRWIAYTGYDDTYQSHQTTKLYVMNRDGSGSRSLSDALDRDAQNPQWAPDNSGVYFMYDDQGDTKLGFYSLDGKFRKLADHIGSTVYNWGGGAFSISRAGTVALTTGTAGNPGDVAVLSKGAIHTVTALNRELLAQKPAGRVEQIWYESSKDQRKIEGWIIYPPDFDPTRKYPLILEIHGGPFYANYGDRFDFEKQIWAAMGYVVLYTNPRGSTSYGQEFANIIGKEFPGDDFYDLNSGVDAVIAKGFVDPHNLFVTGGSGGGILTLWMVEHTDRFSAAASLYPMVSWISGMLTTDFPFAIKYWFAGSPWEDTERYLRLSPLTYVAQVKTPTMLMTGEEDYRTPVTEIAQFYTALQLLNVETVLVPVPGEGHGIMGRPSHHMDKMLYVAGWFEQHKSTQ